MAAWLGYFATDSFKVDNNPITSFALYPMLLFFFGGILLNFYGYIQLSRLPALCLEKIKSVAELGILLSVLIPPFLSNDVMIYIANGDLMNQGLVTYVNADLIHQSKYVSYVSSDWLSCPNHYGPFLLTLFGISTWLGKTLVGSLIVFKIIVAVSAYLFVQLVFLLLKKQNLQSRKYNVMSLICLAPILWLQAVGQMHVDGIIMTLVMGMIFFIHQKKWNFAIILMSFILLSKLMYAVVFFPFFLIYLWHHLDFDRMICLKKTIFSFLMIALISISFYMPFWEGLPTLTTSVQYHENKVPSRSHVEVLTDIIFYGKKLFSSGSELDLENVATKDSSFTNNKITISKPLTSFFKILGILLAGWVFIGLGFVRSHQSILHIFGKILIIVLCFYSPIFHPWYFLLALPFFIFTDEKSWVIFIAGVFSFSNLHEIAFSIPKDSALYLSSLLFVFFMVLSFFIFFKKHFLLETFHLIKKENFVLRWNTDKE